MAKCAANGKGRFAPLRAAVGQFAITRLGGRLQRRGNSANPSTAWSLAHALDSIVDWHQAWLGGADIHNKTLDQIKHYQSN